MIKSMRHEGLRLLWNAGRELEYQTLDAKRILDTLYAINVADIPQDAAFIGFRYDEWIEDGQQRHGIMVSDHWLISFGWDDGHAVDVDLERLD